MNKPAAPSGVAGDGHHLKATRPRRTSPKSRVRKESACGEQLEMEFAAEPDHSQWWLALSPFEVATSFAPELLADRAAWELRSLRHPDPP